MGRPEPGSIRLTGGAEAGREVKSNHGLRRNFTSMRRTEPPGRIILRTPSQSGASADQAGGCAGGSRGSDRYGKRQS